MKKIFIFTFYLIIFINAYSFFTDSYPLDNDRLIEESKIGYLYDILPDSLNHEDSEPKIYEPVLSYKPIELEDGDITKPIDPANDNFLIAESYFEKQDYNKALQFYEKAFELDNQNLKYIAYAAQCHQLLGDTKKSLSLCKEYIDKNYHYYLLHYLLALAYLDLGNIDQAKDEIILAHLLNRNHSYIIKAKDLILSELNEKQVSWDAYIKSNIHVKQDTVIIYVSQDSTRNFEEYYYLRCKALWLSDSTFVSERKITLFDELNLAIAMELDCYHNQLSAYQIYDIEDKEPIEVKEFDKAVQDGYENQFILYEKILVDEPSLAMNISPKGLHQLLLYVKKFKIEKI